MQELSMATLANVLHNPELHLVPLWNPHADLSVRWGAVSDLENPTPFLEGGELLMTTSAGNPRTPAAWKNYVSRLKKAGVAALAFAVGEWRTEVPSELIAAARESDMNLIEVPEDERFVHISQVLARMLEDESNAATQHLQRAQRSLIAATSRLEPTTALLGALARIIDGAVMLYVGDARIHAAGITSARPVPDFVIAQLKKQHPRGERSWAIIEPEFTAIGMSVGAGEVLVAYTKSLSQWQRAALSDGAILLESVRALENQQRENRRNLYARAFERLNDGDVFSCRAILSVIDGEYTVPEKVSALHARGYHRALVDLGEELVRRLHTPLPEKIHSPHAEHTAGHSAAFSQETPLLPPTHSTTTEPFSSLDVVIPAKSVPLACAVVNESGILAGFGTVSAGKSAHTAVMTARIAAEKAHPDRTVVMWNEISGEGLLPLLNNERLSAWAEAFLAPLEQHPELAQALAVFISTNGNRGAMAAILGVHRNTVTTRISHIERLLHRNLADPASRVEAWVALRSQAGFADSIREFGSLSAM
ncbi:MAG: PucR family transcriptional regulator [Arcanobacterium sp.]|nr:PucR family transcriptional regulator [Arcanobacterium sp.]MDY5589804.1 PucR family transcriptional regulator [Arcanobacterium sp.]